MSKFREDKPKTSGCNYNSVSNSQLYMGPPCLQPSNERSAFDIAFNNKYAKMYNSVEKYSEFPANCTACNSCVDEETDLYVKGNAIPQHPMMRFMKQ